MGGATRVNSPGGRGISLDGVDDFVNFGQPAILDFILQDFTVEAWVAIEPPLSGDQFRIFGKDKPWGLVISTRPKGILYGFAAAPAAI